ncbi:hypothetical protein PCH_Pc03g00030 [Penicillium rubens Wisconsin 54-1255]|uniref:Uncharacterized protein n=1 Tax=Penicillium rubens (strain ATCC 28089 / DSM 1075 / NRRL 1951 / Wisconsin 54-1255) TaxID=500485 RepID=B6GVQ2_PENRW|nr:hypothetical protein PCH_Pc03g00030 [Penicillium rubens Wisconsin 54-1255]
MALLLGKTHGDSTKVVSKWYSTGLPCLNPPVSKPAARDIVKVVHKPLAISLYVMAVCHRILPARAYFSCGYNYVGCGTPQSVTGSSLVIDVTAAGVHVQPGLSNDLPA